MPWSRRSILLAPLLAACRKQPSPTVFVDPALSTLVPPDTTWMAGIRMEKIRGTPLYQEFVIKRKLPIVDNFFRSSGLDLNKDLWEVLLMGDTKGSVAMLRGKFSEMGMEPKIAKEGAIRFGHKGFTFVGDDEQAVAFLNPTTALAGSVPALRYIIDHRNETSGLPAAIQSRVAKISSANQIWFAGSLSTVVPLLTAPFSNLGKILTAIRFLSGGIDVSRGMKAHMLAETTSSEEANRLRDSAKGVVGMGRLSTPADSVDLLRVYDTFQAEADGSNLRLSLEAGPEELSALSRMTVPHFR